MIILNTNDVGYYQPISVVPAWQQVGKSSAWAAYPLTEEMQRHLLNNVINLDMTKRPNTYTQYQIVTNPSTGAPGAKGNTSWIMRQTNAQIQASSSSNVSNQIAYKILNNATPTPSYY